MKTKNNKKHRRIIFAYVILAFLAPILANERPLYVSIDGENYFPAFSNNAYFPLNGTMQLINTVDWKNLRCDRKIFAPIRWSPVKSDLPNIYSSPFDRQYRFTGNVASELNFSERHFLGTGRLGNDAFADLIHGTRTSLLIGFFSMFIAVIIGVSLGALAGYFGDTTIRMSRIQLLFSILLILPAWFYGFYIRSAIIQSAFRESMLLTIIHMFISIAIFLVIVSLPLFIRSKKSKRLIFLPVDSIVSRIIEIFVALPKLVLILTIAAIFHSSATLVILLIGFTSWTEIARVTRAKLLQLKQQNFIEAAKASGSGSIRILYSHILPNIKDQIVSIAIFVVASAIMIETGLSFLGIGVQPGTPTWGQMMYEAKQHYSAWWLVIFSGLAIAGLLYSLFVLSQRGDDKNRNEKIIFTESILTNS